MKSFFPRLSFLLIVCSALTAKAQLGKSIYGGITHSSFRNDTISSKGGIRYEFGYGLFAKYSARLEWTSSIGFLAVKRSDVTVYSAQTDPNFGGEIYTPTTADFNTSQLNFNYMLSYYIIPDQLAITGAFDLGFDFLSSFKRSQADPNLFRAKITTDEYSGMPYVEKAAITEIKSPMFTYGPTFGVSYTYDERYVLYARYTLFLNTYFAKKDEMSTVTSTDFTDMSKLSLLRAGFAYKFIPSPKDRRF